MSNSQDWKLAHNAMRLLKDFVRSADARSVTIASELSIELGEEWIAEFRDDDGGWWEGRHTDLTLAIRVAHEAWENDEDDGPLR